MSVNEFGMKKKTRVSIFLYPLTSQVSLNLILNQSQIRCRPEVFVGRVPFHLPQLRWEPAVMGVSGTTDNWKTVWTSTQAPMKRLYPDLSEPQPLQESHIK